MGFAKWLIDLSVGAFLGLAGLNSNALAGTFDVKGAEISKGEHELAVDVGGHSGFPVNAESVRLGLEIGYSYGFSDWFKAGIKLGGDSPVGDRFDATAFAIETQFGILKGEAAPFVLSWYTSVDVALRSGDSEVVTFGPLIGFKAGRFDVTLNPLLQKGWNPESEGLDFTYAWQVKTGVADSLGLGLEGYGTITDIVDAPGGAFQEHRFGPVVYIENPFGKGLKSEVQLGVLFGLTDATADTTGRAKFAVMW